jgi:alcohol dehydrogenase
MKVPPYFEFTCGVKIISGYQSLEKISEELESIGASKPMIITDKGVEEAGIIKLVLSASKIKPSAIFNSVPPDSDLKIVNEAAQIYKAKECDSIIAIGGGSVLDTAKGVNILVSENARDITKFAGYNTIKKKLKPLITIPTTAGTGSEVTQIAVVKDRERKIKMTFVSPFLIPDFAILDPRVTRSLPPLFTAATAMDALSHAVEAYTCLGKNPISDFASIKAIELIYGNLMNVMKKPGDMEGRLALANAALIAGAAFSNSLTGMVHNIGHAVGAVCGVPHGVCMSILLPYGLEYNLHKTAEYTAELLLPIAGTRLYSNTPKKERALKTIELIRKMNEDLHEVTGGRHARFFCEVLNRDGSQSVPENKLAEIAEAALSDAAQFYNPEQADFNDNLLVLKHAYNGSPLDRSKVKKG